MLVANVRRGRGRTCRSRSRSNRSPPWPTGPTPSWTEAAFLTELLDRTGVDLVLDLANLHVNAANRRRAGGAAGPDTDTGTHTDAAALMASLPADRIAYVHVAGGTVQGGRYHDTHTHPLWPEAVTLVEELWARTEPPGLLLERESRVTGDDLDADRTALEAAIARGRARRSSKAASGATTTAADPPPTRRRDRYAGRWARAKRSCSGPSRVGRRHPRASPGPTSTPSPTCSPTSTPTPSARPSPSWP